MKNQVTILGGGIIGLFSAYYLQKQGFEVSILDQGDGSDGCSHGNAGMVVPSHFIPLAAPGMIETGLRWMFDRESPFYVKPRLSLDLLRWGWLFIKQPMPNRWIEPFPLFGIWACIVANYTMI